MLAQRISLLGALALMACTTTAETVSGPNDPGPARMDVNYRVMALNPCEEDPSRYQAIRPRGEDLLLLQVLGPLSEDGSEKPLELTLRAPGACGALPLCGHLLVRVDPTSVDTEALAFRASTRTLEIPLYKLPEPLGSHTIEVQLHGDDGRQALGSDGRPRAETLVVEVVAADSSGCTPQP
ncbi:MAG: hypothetical protein RMJ98_18810 [Myxococcales bacterium]|nr:hypothetical protein [Polyangiaceae bacterium]MDW8251352.1 hypothetical protein [Myxococcales bacterium]